MKKFLSRLPLIGLLVLMCGGFAGCNPESPASFSVSVAEVGPEYVDVLITAPYAVEIAYQVSEKEQRKDNAAVMFVKGTTAKVSPNQVLRITGDLKENTKYWLYIVAKLDAQNYSEIFTLSFTTGSYELSDLATVVSQAYDGYRMRITLPEDTKLRGNAIRYNQCCLMMYNYMNSGSSSGKDDYFTLLYNAGGYTTEDVTLSYSEEDNWFQSDQDSDGDGELDWDTRYNPISPGEPVVFVAGEFAWMEDTKEYENEYFSYPSGWPSGYYIPLIDTLYYASAEKEQSHVGIVTDYEITRPMDSYWTGAFQRKHFRVKEPEPFDGKVDVKCVAASPIDLTLEFYPDDNVTSYAVGVFDDAMYQQVLDLCNGKEEYMQWAITSYFAAYTFGTRVASGAVQMKLTTFYYQDAIAENTDYHVLVTAMGDAMATKQSFQKYTFKTTAKTKEAPVIEVVPVEELTSPYVATFNVKCTTAADNPVTECYYAANYKRDWLLSINSGSTYFSIVAGNKSSVYNTFDEDAIEAVNSPEGYTISIPSVDGEITRIAVLGYNDEYTPNDLTSFQYIEDCPGVADCETPFVEEKDYVDEGLYYDLVGEWTATATLQDGNDIKSTFEHKSKITIASDLYDYPSELTQEVYDLYKESSDYDKEKVDALWDEFNELAKTITDHRLRYQNRLVAIGWLDADSYDRLDARTPYDLFVAKDYSSVDVSSIFNDYGPKWYIEAVSDGKGGVNLIAPFDSNFFPPSSNWSVPFYFCGMEIDDYYTVTYGDGWTPSFPVEVSEDRNTITIKPFVYQDEDGKNKTFYPNMIGIDNTMLTTILENPVISEVVLTRGWNEEGSDKKQSSVRRHSGSVDVKGSFPETEYLPRTELKETAPLKQIEGSLVNVDQFKANADRLVEKMYKNNNR